MEDTVQQYLYTVQEGGRLFQNLQLGQSFFGIELQALGTVCRNKWTNVAQNLAYSRIQYCWTAYEVQFRQKNNKFRFLQFAGAAKFYLVKLGLVWDVG